MARLLALGIDVWLHTRLLSALLIEHIGKPRKIQVVTHHRGRTPKLRPGFDILAVVYPDGRIDFQPPLG